MFAKIKALINVGLGVAVTLLKFIATFIQAMLALVMIFFGTVVLFIVLTAVKPAIWLVTWLVSLLLKDDRESAVEFMTILVGILSGWIKTLTSRLDEIKSKADSAQTIVPEAA